MRDTGNFLSESWLVSHRQRECTPVDFANLIRVLIRVLMWHTSFSPVDGWLMIG